MLSSQEGVINLFLMSVHMLRCQDAIIPCFMALYDSPCSLPDGIWSAQYMQHPNTKATPHYEYIRG